MILFQEILDNINDMCQNYDVTTIDKGNVERQANRGIEYVQRRLGLPSDKKTFSFYYYEDTKYYDCPVDFSEFLQLYYDTTNPNINDYNRPRNRWNSTKDTEINNWTSGFQLKNKVGVTGINGKSQLLLSGHNIRGSQTIDTFDSINGLTFSADISNTSIDTTIFIEGSGSLKFNTSNSLSASQVTYSGLWNIQDLLKYNSGYRLYVRFPTGSTTQFSNIELRLQSSTGNYYSILATTQNDGSTWTENAWDLIGWNLSSATTVGTPDGTMINQIQIIFNHSGSYTSVTNLRIDYLYEINPDYLVCSYYSNYKGTDTTGTTPKVILDEPSDICYFGNFAPDLVEIVALRATLKLFPQLRGDQNFYAMYKAEMDDALKTWGRIYPHQRATGIFGQTEILR